MARLELYLTQPLTEAVGWALLHSLWQGALVALLFAVGLTLLRGRNPQLRYLLGCAALVLLIALPAVTGVTLYNSGTHHAALPDLEPTVSTASAERIAPRQGEVATSTILAAPLASSPLENFTAHVMITLQNSAPWLAAVWLVGVVLLLLRLLGQALYVHRFRAHQISADAAWQARALALASRLGVRHAWRLVQSDRTDSPLTLGVLRPLIVLPTSAIIGMPAVQLEAVLAHELAHIKRHDYLVNLVQCVVETLLFYHPAVWWVSGEVRRAREECCDDLAVSLCGDAKLYARALTNLETLRQQRPNLALAATDMPLLARVLRLLGLREAQHTPPLTTGVLLLITLVVSTSLGMSGQRALAQEEKDKVTSAASQEATVEAANVKGFVVWKDTAIPNVEVKLQREPVMARDGTWQVPPPPFLGTTTTNARGEYAFTDVPIGVYNVWTVGPADVYQPAASSVNVTSATASTYSLVRLEKKLEVIGPSGTTGTSLTPTFRWKPFPGAAYYTVNLYDWSEDGPLTALSDSRTTRTSYQVTSPLERNRVYNWTVTAYTEDGTPIANVYNPVISTGPKKAHVPVALENIGVSTVIFADWQQTAPGVFEYVNAKGEKNVVSFEKFTGTDVAAAVGTESAQLTTGIPEYYAGRAWRSYGSRGNGVKLATVQGDSVYVITLRNSDILAAATAELYGLAVPLMLQNFKIDG